MAGAKHAPAKVSRPRLKAVYSRTRLFRRLDACANSPVAWISGPAGAGKTLLVESYLRRKKRVCLWYQLDEGDADPATFFYYLGVAAQRAAPRRRKPLPLFTPEYQAGTAAFARRFFDSLSRRLPAGAVLVFDNYEQVPEGALVSSILAQGALELPQGMRVFVLSRHAPPPVYARLRAEGTLNVVKPEELRLTAEEADGISALHERPGRAQLSKTLRRSLHARAQGWAAGLVLLIEQMQLDSTRLESDAIDAPGLIFDYFAHELFQGASKSVQNFLMCTAVPTTFSAQLAARLTGFKGARALLSRLIEDNFFTNRLTGRVVRYRYHPLFRDFLLERARESFSDERFRQVQTTCAEARAEDGDYEEAIRLYRECEAWPALSALVVEHAGSVFNQGRFRTLIEWIEAIPAGAREQEPWLLYWLGSAQAFMDSALSRRTLLQALHRFEACADDAGAYLTTARSLESCFIDWNDFRDLDDWIESAYRLRNRFPDYPSSYVEWRVVATMVQAMIMRNPLHEELGTWIRRFGDVLARRDGILQSLGTTYAEFSYFLMRGDLLGMRRIMDALRPLAQQPDIPPLVRLFWLVNVAEEAFYRLENRVSIQTVEEGLALAQETGVHWRDNCFLDSGVKAAISDRDIELAEAYLDRMEPYVGSSAGFYTLRYHRNRSQIAFYKGDLDEAERQIRLVLEFSESRGFTFHRIDCLIGQATICAARGHWAESQRTLRDLCRAGRHMDNPFLMFAAGLGRAWLALRRERPALATRALRTTLALGRANGLYYVEWWQPDGLAALIAHALQSGIEPEYCRRLIDKYRLLPPANQAAPKSWPWALRIDLLGPPRLVRHGEPLRFSAKAQQKPLELLNALVALGGQDVSTTSICEQLWPDADGDDAQRAFGVTLHRLRKLVGNEPLVLRERRLSLDPQYCWVDVIALTDYESEVRRALDGGDLSGGHRALDAALALYRGPLLEGDDSLPIFHAQRERLQQRVLASIDRLTAALLDQGHISDAIPLIRKGLEIDPLAESLYRQLMQAQLRLGQHGDAVATYRRCVGFLQHEGVAPAPETEALHRSISV